MAFVGRLTGHSEGLRDLSPGPALVDRGLDCGKLETIREPAEGDNRCEGFSRFLGTWDACQDIHGVNRS